MGGLIFNQRDASALYYRRNRYYDSDKGRFTQEDPIGLAGGANVYGFADGDPISYSDAFGLQVCHPCGWEGDPKNVEREVSQLEGIPPREKVRMALGYLFVATGVGAIAELGGGTGLLAWLGIGGAGAVGGASKGAAAIDEILMPGGTPVGTAGSSIGIRELTGGLSEAQAMFSKLSANGQVVQSNYPGTLVRFANGATVGLRTVMSRSPNTAVTIDVNIPNIPIDKIKFNP